MSLTPWTVSVECDEKKAKNGRVPGYWEKYLYFDRLAENIYILKQLHNLSCFDTFIGNQK